MLEYRIEDCSSRMPFKIEPIGHGRALTCYIYLREKAEESDESSDEFSDTEDESDESEWTDSDDESFQAQSDTRSTREEKSEF